MIMQSDKVYFSNATTSILYNVCMVVSLYNLFLANLLIAGGRLFISLLCTVSLSFTPRVFAASNPIAVTSRSQTSHFPSNIEFNITANDSRSNIIHATISVNYILGGIFGGSQAVRIYI
jgi:hypothetical protein